MLFRSISALIASQLVCVYRFTIFASHVTCLYGTDSYVVCKYDTIKHEWFRYFIAPPYIRSHKENSVTCSNIGYRTQIWQIIRVFRQKHIE